MEELAEGCERVSYTVPDLSWAARMVLSYIGLGVTEEPPELLERVRMWAQTVAEQHGVQASS